MYLDPRTAETAAEQPGPLQSAEMPSPELRAVSAKIVVDSYLMHNAPEKREEFLGELTSALESDAQTSLFVLAGLKAAGLGYRKAENQLSLSMKHPKLSNPTFGEFSSQLSSALASSNGALELLIDRGQQDMHEPQTKHEMKQWLANMEAASQNSPLMDKVDRRMHKV